MAASRFAGVPVVRTKILGFVFAALTAGVAALLWIGQYGSARADNADGSILFILTAVVLGGVAIEGGSGSVTGVALSILLLGTITNGMGLANVPGTTQSLVQGLLLVLSIGIPKAVGLIRARRQPRPTVAPIPIGPIDDQA